jgi:hypothetical protein
LELAGPSSMDLESRARGRLTEASLSGIHFLSFRLFFWTLPSSGDAGLHARGVRRVYGLRQKAAHERMNVSRTLEPTRINRQRRTEAWFH